MRYYGRIFLTLCPPVIVALWHLSYLLINQADTYRFLIADGFLKYDFIYTPFLLPLFWWFGKKYDEAKFFSEKDFLTKVYNRRFVIDIFPKLIERVNRNHQNLSIHILDIDNFKEINDSYGHKLGDLVIEQISKILLSHTRKSDIVARWGGDEFLIIIQNNSGFSPSELLRRIELDMHQMSKRVGMKISVSVGNADYYGKEQSLDKLVSLADQRMYQMKREHKGIS